MTFSYVRLQSKQGFVEAGPDRLRKSFPSYVGNSSCPSQNFKRPGLQKCRNFLNVRCFRKLSLLIPKILFFFSLLPLISAIANITIYNLPLGTRCQSQYLRNADEDKTKKSKNPIAKVLCSWEFLKRSGLVVESKCRAN